MRTQLTRRGFGSLWTVRVQSWVGCRSELHPGSLQIPKRSFSLPANSHRHWFLGHSPRSGVITHRLSAPDLCLSVMNITNELYVDCLLLRRNGYRQYLQALNHERRQVIRLAATDEVPVHDDFGV